ncbi:MAG TPA: hypothetical protein VGL69_11340 [Solirubrobacteraceae bacterium]
MRTPARSIVTRGVLSLGIALALGLLLTAEFARAGEWVQVSCENPNGTPASSQGWTGSALGSPPPGSTADTTCAPGTPLSAGLVSAYGAAPGGSAEVLQYTPPAGSTLAGGTLQVSLSSTSDAPNLAAVSETSIYSPADTLSDRLISCIPYLGYCPTGTTDSTTAYTGPVALPQGAGGGVTVLAQCDSSSSSCQQGDSSGYWARAEVSSADLLLTSDVSPVGQGFSGSGLQRGARGTAHVVFTAQDPNGPGVYSVSAAVGGRVVWSGQPNDNGGACVAAGTDGSALMFDSAQPCLASETVDIPVPTRSLPDGRHELAISVTDAAGNSSTVLDREISTSNPRATPAPRRGIRTRFYLGWDWNGPVTRLDSASARRLPRHGRVAVSCQGRHCPALRRHSATGARAVHRLLRSLRGRRFHAGDRVFIEVRSGHRRPERIELLFRRGRMPVARLRKR